VRRQLVLTIGSTEGAEVEHIDAWSKQAERVRELARDHTARAYLLGRLCAELDAAELADLVEATLVYRERFGATRDHAGWAFAEAVTAQLSRTVSTDTPERGGRRP
jgi:hypothetical protein